jgi:hypothetical protein
MHQAIYKKFVINEGDMDEGVQALRDAGLFLPVYDSSETPLLEAPASVLPRGKDADQEDGDEEDEAEEVHAYHEDVALTTQPKDAAQTPATAPVVVLPPPAHAMLPATEPLAPPQHMSKILCREGIHPSIRFGTITGLPSADCVEAELQVSPSKVDDYGTGIFVNNNDEVYVIGQTLCDASTGFYRVATADKCVGFILMEFVQLHD